MLQLDKITVRYGEKTVFHRFSHTFPKRGVVAVTGVSGSGKTTLLRLVAGVERPAAGRVLLAPDTVFSMVFQEDRLLPTLDARGNVLAALGKGAEAAALADRCLARCGLAGEETRYPAELSGGMRRRVAIARAMAVDSGILLLDEPFKGLDDALRRRVADFVLERRDRLVLLATHASADIALADHVLHLPEPAGG